MNKSFSILALLAIMVFSYACRKKEDSSGVSQSRIFAQYKLSYDANTNISTASADFSLDKATGAIIILSNPSNVTFNNTVLTYHSAKKNYSATFNGKVDSGTFVWTDYKNVVYSNKIYMIGYESEFQSRLITMYSNQLYQLFWQGYALGANEKMTLTLSGFDSVSTETFTESRLNSASITVNLNQHANKPNDTGKADLEHTGLYPLEHGTTAGGTKSFSYKAATADVQMY